MNFVFQYTRLDLSALYGSHYPFKPGITVVIMISFVNFDKIYCCIVCNSGTWLHSNVLVAPAELILILFLMMVVCRNWIATAGLYLLKRGEKQ